jgi:nucleoside-triphosphatase
MESHFRVGKYRVDVEGLERFLVAISLPDSSSRVLIVDEIGKMECFSNMFRKHVLQLIEDEGKVIVATIAKKGTGLIADLKARSDVSITEMTTINRDRLIHHIVAGVRAAIDTF